MTRSNRFSCHQQYRRNKSNFQYQNQSHSRLPLVFHKLPTVLILFRSFRTSSSPSTQIAETKPGRTRHHLIRRRVMHLLSVFEAVLLPQSKVWAYRSHIQHLSSRKTVRPRGKNHQRHHLGKRSLLSRQRLLYSLVISLSSFQRMQTATIKGHRHLGLYENSWARIHGECLRPNNPGARITNPRESRRPRAQAPRYKQTRKLCTCLAYTRGYELIAYLEHGWRVHMGSSKLAIDWRDDGVRTIGDAVCQVNSWRDLSSKWRWRCGSRSPVVAVYWWEVFDLTLVFVYCSLCRYTLHHQPQAVSTKQRRLVMIVKFKLKAKTIMEGSDGAFRRSWIRHSVYHTRTVRRHRHEKCQYYAVGITVGPR